jgi:hypothetical protein
MKDAKGHGSDSRGGAVTPDDRRTPGESRVGSGLGLDKSFVYSALLPSERSLTSDREAANALSSGPKSAVAPVHDAWSNTPGGDRVAFNVDPKTGPTPEQSAYAQRTMHGVNAWGQNPKDAAATRKSIRDQKKQAKFLRGYSYR